MGGGGTSALDNISLMFDKMESDFFWHLRYIKQRPESSWIMIRRYAVAGSLKPATETVGGIWMMEDKFSSELTETYSFQFLVQGKMEQHRMWTWKAWASLSHSVAGWSRVNCLRSLSLKISFHLLKIHSKWWLLPKWRWINLYGIKAVP